MVFIGCIYIERDMYLSTDVSGSRRRVYFTALIPLYLYLRLIDRGTRAWAFIAHSIEYCILPAACATHSLGWVGRSVYDGSEKESGISHSYSLQ